MPKPKNQFSRNSITLGGPKRAWADVAADSVTAGTLVADFGLVVETQKTPTDQVLLTNVVGGQAVLSPAAIVRALVEV